MREQILQRRKQQEEALKAKAKEIEEQKEQTDEETNRRVAYARQSATERAGSEKPSKLRQPSVKVGANMRTQSQTGSEKGQTVKGKKKVEKTAKDKDKEATDGSKSADPSELVRNMVAIK